MSARFLLRLLCTVFASAAAAQEAPDCEMMLLDARTGLTENKVRGVVPLADGRVAIFTSADVMCFDGVQMTGEPFALKHSYVLANADSRYRVQATDADSIFWRKDRRQLHAVDLKTMSEADSIGRLFRQWGVNDSVADFFVDDDGRHWLLGVGGTLYLHEGSGSARQMEGRTDCDILAVASVRQRGYVCHATGEVEEYDCRTGRRIALTRPVPPEMSDSLKAYAEARVHRGRLWLLRPYANRMRRDRGDGTRVQQTVLTSMEISTRRWTAPERIDGVLYDMAFTPEGQMLVTGDEHCYLRNLQSGATRDLMPVTVNDNITGRLLHDDICCLTVDSDGGWWMGLLSKGLLYYHPTRLKLFVRSGGALSHLDRLPLYCDGDMEAAVKSIAPETTNCTLRDTRGYLYIGTRGGLIISDPECRRQRCLTSADGLVGNNVVALDEDRDGDVWVVTAGGICCLSPKEEGRWRLRRFGLTEGLILAGSEFQNRLIAHRGDSVCAGFADGVYSFVPERAKEAGGYTTDISLTDAGTSDGTPLSPVWLTLAALLLVVAVGLAAVKRRRGRAGAAELQRGDAAGHTAEENLQRLMAPSADAGAVLSADERFLEKLRATVMDNLNDEHLNVNTLSRLMAMDRSVLYRRMQSLTATTPSDYILNLRMQTAKHLLQDKGYAVGEVAQRVGFGNTKYFSVVFKKTFGITPMQAKDLHKD